MEFPKEFIQKVKKEFPCWKRLHAALDQGEAEIVIRCLDESNDFEMTPEKIVSAFKRDRQDEVLRAAEKSIRIGKLYNQFLKLYAG